MWKNSLFKGEAIIICPAEFSKYQNPLRCKSNVIKYNQLLICIIPFYLACNNPIKDLKHRQITKAAYTHTWLM